MKINQSNAGFTMLELTVATSIILILASVTFVALQSSIQSAEIASSKSMVMGNVRDVLSSMSMELTEASKRTDDSFNPPLSALAVVNNPATGSPVEIVFQTPVDRSGRNWTLPIRYRFIREDTNRNGVLDQGEDTDGDRKLARRIVRIFDANGDGDTTDEGEIQPVGAASNISDVNFALNGDLLTITVTASDLIGSSREQPVQTTVSTSVYVLN